ncbi:Gmad2 immunoglobulin-like domain-containing protein [Patescibacteria group bacterium]
MKKLTFVIILIVIGFIFIVVLGNRDVEAPSETPGLSINSFEECIAVGYPILESYPRQCKTPDGETFIEDIGNELEKLDIIRTDTPRPNELVQSPLEIKGEARGYWFFEADFPIRLLDGNNNVIARGIGQAKGEWMTEDFVQFTTMLDFQAPATKKGTLILDRDNPSDLPENADELRIPVRFSE